MIAIDTNLLVYAHRSDVPEHAASVQTLAPLFAAEKPWGFSQPVGGEFWSIVTHPPLWKRSSLPKEAERFLRYAIEDAGAQIFLPSEGFTARLARLAADLNILGARIYDLQIALMALEGGATELWTHDPHFVAPADIRLVDPLTP